MAFPLSIDDCFLNTNVNRFPVEDALKHKSRILEEGRPGKTVDIYQIDGMKMGYNFSDKQLADYPFQGGNIDAPVVIYEDPPEEGGVFDYTYVSSLDPYKSDKADTDSVGSFYVLKRYVKINDPFAYCIVASYVSRPPSSDDFVGIVKYFKRRMELSVLWRMPTECMNFILRDEISSLCCWKMANVLPVRLSVPEPVRTTSSVWLLRFPISACFSIPLFNIVGRMLLLGMMMMVMK